ncbi:MAG TPA: alpha/beta hydrolase [Bacteroidota bacterium]|jgi:pimeloyl-ACP methyl ester carboxylesterase|nr:alpha/beta hydrolase [Bacteroidota bacterium]
MLTSHDKIRFVLLPGFHGTGGLFEPFLKECPAEFDPLVVSFPGDRWLSYDDLERLTLTRLRANTSKLLFLGESYSGPLALRLALHFPDHVVGVILIASFVLPPAARWYRFLPWESYFVFSKPIYAIRALMARSKEKALIIKQISGELARATPSVLAWRVKEALRCDATGALLACHAPVLYLHGTKDTVVSRKSLDTILGIRRNVFCRRIDAPHFLLQSAPKEAWSAITDFLGKTRAPA